MPRPVPISVAHRFIAGLVLVFVLSLTAGISVVRAADTKCADDDSPACQADAAERVAIYIKGRTAYDDARATGDFTQALTLARQLAVRGDKNGERLLKMVYLQLGWGTHRDYVQAYAWLSEGIAGGEEYLVRWRKLLAEKMTPEQLAEAKKMAGN